MKATRLFVLCGGLFLLAVATRCDSGGGGAGAGKGGATAGGGNSGTSGLQDGSVVDANTAGTTADDARSSDAGSGDGMPSACAPPPKLKLTLVTKTIIPAAWTTAGWKAAPLTLTQAKGDPRIFVGQRGGHILILRNGVLEPDPFLDMSAVLAAVPFSNHGERGLIKVELHPDYLNNGRFFVYFLAHTDAAWGSFEGDVVVAEGKRSAANPDKADPTVKPLMVIEHSELEGPRYDDGHNGGLLVFGKDGALWVGVGDGGNSRDYFHTGQDANHPLAKLYKIDVDNPPADPHKLSEYVWAMGIRNPWRGSVDPLTGDLYIGDVQETHWEEINWQPFGTPKGLNYGYGNPGMEGTHCFPAYVTDCVPFGVMPLYEYPHKPTGDMTHPKDPLQAETVTYRTAVVAGFVYRGSKIPGMQGRFIFGDHGENSVHSLINTGGQVTCVEDHTPDLDPDQAGNPLIRELIGFGQDAEGELYLLDMDMAGAAKNSHIYKIEAAN